MITSPLLLSRLSFLASLLLSPSIGAQIPPHDQTLGPPVIFSRSGFTVCASYAKDQAFNLYRKHIFARQGTLPLVLSGLPTGRSQSADAPSESIIDSAFKACTITPSATDELLWIDQSCLSTQGVCLPPRAYSVSSHGVSTPLSSSRAADLFSQSLHPSPSVPSNPWSFGFKAK